MAINILIFSETRSGSHFFSNALSQALGLPEKREFLNPLFREKCGFREGRNELLELARIVRKTNGVTPYIFDMKSEVLRHYLNAFPRLGLNESLRVNLIYHLLGKPLLLRIERKDKVSQAISYHVSRETGIYHVWDDGQGQEARYDFEKIRKYYDQYRQDSVAFDARINLIRSRTTRVYYEDLCKDLEGQIESVSESLYLPLVNRNFDMSIEVKTTLQDVKEDFRRKFLSDMKTRFGVMEECSL